MAVSESVANSIYNGTVSNTDSTHLTSLGSNQYSVSCKLSNTGHSGVYSVAFLAQFRNSLRSQFGHPAFSSHSRDQEQHRRNHSKLEEGKAWHTADNAKTTTHSVRPVQKACMRVWACVYSWLLQGLTAATAGTAVACRKQYTGTGSTRAWVSYTQHPHRPGCAHTHSDPCTHTSTDMTVTNRMRPHELWAPP